MHKFLLFFFLSTSAFAGVVDDGLKHLSWHEIACMKVFFDEALKCDQASHVLFYDHKPASLTAIVLKDKYKSFRGRQSLKGWQAFKKNEHFFSHPDFIINENVVAFSDNFVVLHVYFINKQALEKCVDQHLPLFKEHFGGNFTFEDFIVKLQEQGLRNLLKGNETLHGIILGFGDESSRAYHQANANRPNDYAPPETETYCHIGIRKPPGCRINPVVFAGNPHSDQVKELCHVYEQELQDTWKVYRANKNHLRMMLRALCSE
jgi:hypothetical protein